MKYALLSAALLAVAASAPAQVVVASHHYDAARTGNNDEETTLNVSNVTTQRFGKIATLPVDGQTYAQPLYIPNVNVSGKGTRNVLYVATMNNSLYAFDADSSSSVPLWKVNFNVGGATPIPFLDVESSSDINLPIGILSTPAIDVGNNTIYVLVRTKEGGSYPQRLHALDIRSGAEIQNSPRLITASAKQSNGTIVTFDSQKQNQRVPLVISNGMVYLSWASHNDRGPYHGWVMAYRIVQNGLTQAAVYNDTLDGAYGGIWQAGSAPVVDPAGNLYFAVGNGDWNGTTNMGQSIIKLSPTLKLLDYFTPDNWLIESNKDIDLGSGGLVLLPGTNYLVTGSKQGILYTMNTSNMGHLVPGNTQIPQLFPAATGHIHSGPTYYDSPKYGPLIYIWAENGDYLRAYHFNGNDFDTAVKMKGTFRCPYGMPGGFLTVTSNHSKANSGIVWVLMPFGGNGNQQTVPGVLRAFDADDLTRELWNSNINQRRDDIGNFAKYVPPVVANGKVYAASFSNSVAVYGLLSAPKSVIQINAGGSTVGSWHSDTYVAGGRIAGNNKNIDLSGDPYAPPADVFKYERFGGMVYTFPNLLPNNGYQVRMHFAETYWTKTGQRKFNVSINGKQSLSQFDVAAAAGGVNKAVMEQFDAVADASGRIILNFTPGSADYPQVNGIEIVSNTTNPTVVAINAGGGTNGPFLSDRNVQNGTIASTKALINLDAVANSAPQGVYQTERYGTSTYTIPNLTAGKIYTVRLHFAEQYWTKARQRVFNVAINGTMVLGSMDIASTVGANKAIALNFTSIARSDGTIKIEFINGRADTATISGIEIY